MQAFLNTGSDFLVEKTEWETAEIKRWTNNIFEAGKDW